jgi:asparagine synthase (glutamine-hydrolysing)
MCGIAGRFNFRSEAPVSEAVLRGMCDLLAHRGPDGSGVHVDGAIGLGHRRLAVLDPSPRGRQPMHAFGLWITHNGEIYNFADLRTNLEGRGHQFRTETDTEVILAAFREWGPACLSRLIGMFAFVIWDPATRTLFAARDRLGQKPLSYRLDADGFSWASETRAFLADPAFRPEADPAVLAEYLALLYVPGSHSAFRGVQRLPPAHSLTIHNGSVQTSRYWEPAFVPKSPAGEAAAAAELDARLETAVRRRLVSDVPVGAFLSGGIDSATVVAFMARASPTPVRTFSIGFAEAQYDELQFAREVAQRFGTDHHEFIVRPDAVEILPTLVWHYSEPYADSSAIPTFYLSKLTRQSVTVALNGDGGDEMFAGYDRYRAMCLAERMDRVPRSARRALAAAGASLPRGRRHPTLERASRFLTAAPADAAARYAGWMTFIRPDLGRRLFAEDFAAAARGADPAAYLRSFRDASSADNVLDATLDVDLHTYLPDDLLVKVDVASMAYGLEARSPFLDHELVEFVAALPASFKLRGNVSKYLLRAVARPMMPQALLGRRKKGFGVPLDVWFRGELRGFVRDILTSARARQRHYFRAGAVERLITEHQSGRRNWHHQLWCLVVFELWHRLFIDQRPSGPDASLVA